MPSTRLIDLRFKIGRMQATVRQRLADVRARKEAIGLARSGDVAPGVDQQLDGLRADVRALSAEIRLAQRTVERIERAGENAATP